MTETNMADRLTRVETVLDAHLRECKEGNRRQEKQMDEVQRTFRDFARDFKDSQARLHQRLDEQSTRVENGFGEAAGARKDLRIAGLVAAVFGLLWVVNRLLDGGLPGLIG